jgi:hypothetical protein
MVDRLWRAVSHSHGIAIYKRLNATHERQLVQIANSLTEQCGHKSFQISGFWPDDGQTGQNCKVGRRIMVWWHGGHRP